MSTWVSRWRRRRRCADNSPNWPDPSPIAQDKKCLVRESLTCMIALDEVNGNKNSHGRYYFFDTPGWFSLKILFLLLWKLGWDDSRIVQKMSYGPYGPLFIQLQVKYGPCRPYDIIFSRNHFKSVQEKRFEDKYAKVLVKNVCPIHRPDPRVCSCGRPTTQLWLFNLTAWCPRQYASVQY